MSVLLTAVSGLWVASTAHKDIVYYYYIALLPVLTMLLLAAAGISLRKIADAGKDVSEQFDTLSLPGFGKGSTIDDVQVRCGAVPCYAICLPVSRNGSIKHRHHACLYCTSTLLYSTLLYSTLLYSTLLYSTILCPHHCHLSRIYLFLTYSQIHESACFSLVCMLS